MRRPAGFAMVGALLALLLAALFGATMADLGRTELTLARSGTRFATGLAALDECAARVLRSLPLGWSFADVLAGPDAAPGTGDDGILPAPAPCVASAGPLGGGVPRMLVDFESMRSGGRRAGRAVVGRSTRPGPPALLWLGAGDRAGRVAGTLVLDGAAADEAPWASLASPDDPALLDAWIAGESGVSLAGPTSAPLWAPPPPVTALVDAARAAGAVAPAAALAPGTPAPEVLALADGDLAIADARWVRGLLVVAGRLRVQGGGTLAIEGLLVAAGGIEIAFGGTAHVRGAVWTGTPVPGALDVAGSLRVDAAPDALERAATLLTLPHEARLLGWLDR